MRSEFLLGDPREADEEVEDEKGAGRKAKKYSREREVVCWLAEFVIAAGSGGGLRMEWRRTRAGGL